MNTGRNEKGQLITTVILGRKFCKECGRYKLLVFFRPKRHTNGKEYPSPYCDYCTPIVRAARHKKNYTGTAREDKIEYARIYNEAKRRSQGMTPRNLSRKIEQVDTRKPLQPLLDWIQWHRPDLSAQELSDISGVDWHVFSGKKPTAYLSTIDQVCVALGRPDLVATLWPD